MDQGFKTCPHCQRPAALQAAECPRCGFLYFAAHSSAPATAQYPPPMTPPPAAAITAAGPFTPGVQFAAGASTMIHGPQEVFRGGFNLGAFAFGWLWGAFHRAYWTFLPFGILAVYLCFAVPLVISSQGQPTPPPALFGLILIHGLAQLCVSLWFGIKGNEWAWGSGRFRTAQECRAAQKGWNIAAGVLLATSALIGFIVGFTSVVLLSQQIYRAPLPTSISAPQAMTPGASDWGSHADRGYSPRPFIPEPVIRTIPIPTIRLQAPRIIQAPTASTYVPAPPVFMGRPTPAPMPGYRPPFIHAPAYQAPMNGQPLYRTPPSVQAPPPPPGFMAPRAGLQPGSPVPAITSVPPTAQAQRV